MEEASEVDAGLVVRLSVGHDGIGVSRRGVP